MTAYEATVVRDGKWWMVSIPAIDGLTQARRLSEATAMAREYVSAAADVPLESVSINLRFAPIGTIDDITAQIAAITESRKHAAELEQAASCQATELARRLTAADIPMRDIGAMLGVSHQRAHQLISPH